MQDLYELMELANKELSKSDTNIKSDLTDLIKQNISACGYIGLAQINPRSGDLEYNAKKISKYIKFGTEIGLETIVFPELSLIGYPLEDTISRHPAIVKENVKWLNGVAKITKNTTVIIGYIEPQDDGKYYNSLAIIKEGQIQSTIRKSLVSQNSKTNDYKYFKPSSNNNKLHNGYGITIGEDIYNEDLCSSLFNKNPHLLINSSASTGKPNEEKMKDNILSFISTKYKTPIVYVNQVGATDSISFCGASSVYDNEGKLIARAKSFEEQLLVANPYEKTGKIYTLPKGLENLNIERESFSLDYEQDLERTYKTIIQGIKDYFGKCGLKRAVLGLSGGLDSTVCAVLMVDAIGKENVFGVSMPSHITSKESKSDAEQLANNLGIGFAETSIRPMIDTTTQCLNELFKKVEKKWDCRYKTSFTHDNIQARARATYLWGVSNEFESCIPIATSDKSEAYMGYATINGDMSGGFAPIADITKTKLFALARWLNKNREEKNAIPESIILKKPGAELAINPKTGKPLIAEDALMPYEFLDEIIWRIENKHESYNDFLDIEFIYEKQNKITKEQKIEWLDKFYRRMSSALFKWTLMPPSVIVETHSINASDYKQPIASCRINYKGVSENYINESLK